MNDDSLIAGNPGMPPVTRRVSQAEGARKSDFGLMKVDRQQTVIMSIMQRILLF
jgi:hypothetical protein